MLLFNKPLLEREEVHGERTDRYLTIISESATHDQDIAAQCSELGMIFARDVPKV